MLSVVRRYENVSFLFALSCFDCAAGEGREGFLSHVSKASKYSLALSVSRERLKPESTL